MHILHLNSELDMSTNSAQWNFTVADLAAVNRTRTPFVVAQWHRLMYSAADSSSSDYTWGDLNLYKGGWDDLMYQNEVDLIVNGEWNGGQSGVRRHVAHGCAAGRLGLPPAAADAAVMHSSTPPLS